MVHDSQLIIASHHSISLPFLPSLSLSSFFLFLHENNILVKKEFIITKNVNNLHRFSFEDTMESSSSRLSAMLNPVVSMDTRKEAATCVLLFSGSSSHDEDCFSDKILLPVSAMLYYYKRSRK